MSKIVDEIAKRNIVKRDIEFRVGDTVDVHVRITEGDKERIQVFTGTVIGRSGGTANETVTVRRLVQGEGIERIFPLNSPRIEKIAVRKTGRVRRAKLNFLRGRTGKATRLAERRTYSGKGAARGEESVDAPAATAEADDGTAEE